MKTDVARFVTQVGCWLDDKARAEQQARTTERLLASITSTAADAILGVDLQGRIASWNDGATMLFGYEGGDIVQQPLARLFGAGEAAHVEVRWLAAAVRSKGFVRGHETHCYDVHGKPIAVDLTATQLTVEQEHAVGMSVILRDITGRRRREQEIQRLNASLNEQAAARTHELAEKVEQLVRANAELQQLDQMRAEFISLVSHQIRAPLTNMRGATERIRAANGATHGTTQRMLTILEQQIARLDRLVQDVLSTARIESGELVVQPEPVPVLPIVHQVVEQNRARTGRRLFRIPIKPGLPLAFADRDRVVEVLANLLDNAARYSPPAEEVRIEVRADQDEITLSVRDAGPGLPTADLERVFEKFYRVDGSDSQAGYGYGLGLYVCRRLVEAQGGRIWAENHRDGGALFSFTLPVAR